MNTLQVGYQRAARRTALDVALEFPLLGGIEAVVDEGGRLALLSPETLARLNAVLPPAWSRGNPVDLVGDAPGRRYADALSVLFEDHGVDAILALNCPTAITSSVEAARAVSETTRSTRSARRVGSSRGRSRECGGRSWKVMPRSCR